MAAYGLYTHIQSNRRRSIILLVGLFLLVYVLVYAGALAAEALSVNADLNTLAAAGLGRSHPRGAGGDAGHGRLGGHRLLLSSEHDRRADRRPRGHAHRTTAALQSSGKSLHLARHHHAQAQGDGERRAQRLLHGHEPEAIRDHDHDRAAQPARRRRGRIGSRPRTHAHPQRRRAHDGHRRRHRRRDLLLRRAGLSALVLYRFQLPRLALLRRSPRRRRRGPGDPDRRRAPRRRLRAVVHHSPRAVALSANTWPTPARWS